MAILWCLLLLLLQDSMGTFAAQVVDGIDCQALLLDFEEHAGDFSWQDFSELVWEGGADHSPEQQCELLLTHFRYEEVAFFPEEANAGAEGDDGSAFLAAAATAGAVASYGELQDEPTEFWWDGLVSYPMPLNAKEVPWLLLPGLGDSMVVLSIAAPFEQRTFPCCISRSGDSWAFGCSAAVLGVVLAGACLGSVDRQWCRGPASTTRGQRGWSAAVSGAFSSRRRDVLVLRAGAVARGASSVRQQDRRCCCMSAACLRSPVGLWRAAAMSSQSCSKMTSLPCRRRH